MAQLDDEPIEAAGAGTRSRQAPGTAAVTPGGRRAAGIERATIGPALLVLALAMLMSVVLPLIDSRTPYRHAIQRGDIVELAAGITLVPTAGWNLATGALAGRTRALVGSTATTELVNGSVNLDVQAAPFAGTPSALLGRVNQISARLHHARGRGPATHRYAVTTRHGEVGVGEDFGGVSRQGSVVAFVVPMRGTNDAQGQATREGLEIVVSGPRGPVSRWRDDIVGMIRSIRNAS